MSFFHTKIDPFSDLSINLGPLYVDRVFDSLLVQLGVEIRVLSPTIRYAAYLDYLMGQKGISSQHHAAILQFYKGHFHQQLAIHVDASISARHHQEKALCYYQEYLEMTAGNEQSHYYAQWQAGLLQDTLQYPWQQTEEALLKATRIDPARGEGLLKIVQHYFQSRQWAQAWHYSSTAVERFLWKNPVADRRWYVDFAAYDKNLLRIHKLIHHKLTHGTANTQAISQHGEL
jgi:hypothetical protein